MPVLCRARFGPGGGLHIVTPLGTATSHSPAQSFWSSVDAHVLFELRFGGLVSGWVADPLAFPVHL